MWGGAGSPRPIVSLAFTRGRGSGWFRASLRLPTLAVRAGHSSAAPSLDVFHERVRSRRDGGDQSYSAMVCAKPCVADEILMGSGKASSRVILLMDPQLAILARDATSHSSIPPLWCLPILQSVCDQSCQSNWSSACMKSTVFRCRCNIPPPTHHPARLSSALQWPHSPPLPRMWQPCESGCRSSVFSAVDRCVWPETCSLTVVSKKVVSIGCGRAGKQTTGLGVGSFRCHLQGAKARWQPGRWADADS